MRLLSNLRAVSALLLVADLASAEAPAARVANVTDTHFGETLTDPYRWMEKTGPEFTKWAHDQDNATRARFRSMSGYAAFVAEEQRAYQAETRISALQRNGDLLFYERQGATDAEPSLFVRPRAGGPERLLVNPISLAGPTANITLYAPSPDNRTLVYAVAEGGSEEAVLHFLDIATAKPLPETIDRARQAVPSWSSDSKFVFYTRMKAHYTDAEDRFADLVVFRHRPGSDPGGDVAIVTAQSLGSELGRHAWIYVVGLPDSHYVLAAANSGVSAESEWFVAAESEVLGPAMAHWRRLSHLADKVDLMPIVHGDEAWLAVFRDASNRKIVSIDLRAPNLMHAKIVVPEQPTVLRNFAAASDGLYANYADPVGFRLERISYDTGIRTDVPMPYAGTIVDLATDPRKAGASITLNSFVKPIQAFDVAGASLRDLKLAPPFGMDISQLATETIYAAAADGTKIPVTVFHRRDMDRDGSAPAVVDAYGAYGQASDEFFNPGFVPFVLRGGVVAEAHVRGGGEYGEAWHVAGKGATKPNTWRDFIAAIHRLEELGFTSRSKVSGIGISAGGIMIGRTVTEAPDLLAGAIMWAPITNAIRFETTEGGPANTAEFGSTESKEGYAALRAMDAYSHVVPGTRYPAVLITIGMNDHRVAPWMGAEMAARLQAATTSGKPVALRVDFEGGHHMLGVTKDDMAAQFADTFAFALEAAGAPEFQPLH
jgi:prolyl oligopeptidase